MEFDLAHAGVVALRLAAALVVGALLGVNRDLHRKSAGLRTITLVSVGSAVLVLVAIDLHATADGVSRVLQGLVVGVGFLGAGVIIHHESEQRIQGLTTAASVWVAAGLGAACGAGLATLALVATIVTMLILLFGGKVERAIEARFERPQQEPPPR